MWAPIGFAAVRATEAVMSATLLANNFTPGRNPRSAFRLVGTSKAWSDVIDRAARVAATDVTTCLQGESGTGKEVVARFIHSSSPRRHGPFIAINCAALPDQLVESELFGFDRGAFTSAQQAKPGQIELARGGVLFLDEITELTPPAQAKLLRVLQEREFQRLGGTRVVRRRRPRGRRHQSRSARSGRARNVPRGSVLPRQRVRHSNSPAPRSRRRRHAAGRDLPRRHRSGTRRRTVHAGTTRG